MSKTLSPSSNGTPKDHEHGKTDYAATGEPFVDPDELDHTALHRGLKSRHITMIAIGGAIGTGLIIGTGVALARAGYVFRSP